MEGEASINAVAAINEAGLTGTVRFYDTDNEGRPLTVIVQAELDLAALKHLWPNSHELKMRVMTHAYNHTFYFQAPRGTLVLVSYVESIDV